MKLPIYTRAHVSALNQKLQESAEDILRRDPQISYKGLLAEAHLQIPELLSDDGNSPPALKQVEHDILNTLGEVGLPKVQQFLSTGQIPTPGLLDGFHLNIWGAGSCGLSLAYLFSCHGAEVVLNERRGKNNFLEACSRTPNISWKRFRETMRSVLSEKDFSQLDDSIMEHGGVIDPISQKLRSSIGGFQEALYKQVAQKGVDIRLGREVSPKRLGDSKNFDIQVVCTGVHAAEQIPGNDLELFSFPDGIGKIFITTTMYPTDRDTGFYRVEWEENQDVPPHGPVSWRRKNINVQPINIFRNEIERFIFNLEKKGSRLSDIQKARSLLNESQIAHVFYFGNQTPSYHHDVGSEQYPCLTEKISIGSWMLARSISFDDKNGPVAFLGDATGGAHPLAAIGAYLSFKNSVDLLKHCACLHNLKSIAHKIPHDSYSTLTKKILYWTEYKMILDRLMVFLQARLCAHYSRLE
ncbi:MAG: hypothetical protein OXB88_03670 [Bacteriovoracales bacterium]|nr:hypothetical protein [Bacteriovoracales bacterium]